MTAETKEITITLTTIPELKRLITEMEHMEESLNLTWNKIYTGVFSWVNNHVQQGKAKTFREALEKLVAPLGRAYITISKWYYTGKLMLETGMDPKTVNHRSAHLLMTRRDMLPQATRLKVLSWIKAGESHKKVEKAIKAVPNLSRDETDLRMKRLEKQGKLTKTQLKVEMLALLTMARKVYEREVVVCVTDQEYHPLMELGGTR